MTDVLRRPAGGRAPPGCLDAAPGVVLGLLLAFLIVLARPAFAAPVDHIVAQAWFEDPRGEMDWAEATRQRLAPFTGVLARGYGDSPLWVRLRIDPAVSGAAPGDLLYLRIRPNYLDELVLYDPLQRPGHLGPIGDRHPLSAQAVPGARFTFVVPAGAAPRELWVRLKSTSTRMARFEVLDARDRAESEAVIDLVGALYLGLLGAFVLWGLVQLALRPEPLMLSFVVYQASAAVFGSGTLGYTRLLFDDLFGHQALDMLASAMAIFATGNALVFGHFLLEEVGPARWRRRLLAALVALFVGLLGLLALGHGIQALRSNMLLILLTPVVLLALALVSRESPDAQTRGNLPKTWVVGYFALTLAFTISAAAPSLGLVEATGFSLHGVLFYSISSGLLMVTMLVYRIHRRLEYQQTLSAQAAANARRADQERLHRIDREKLLAMIGHELKTPLATLRMLLSDRDIPRALSQRMDASVQEMATVVERVVQSAQIEDRSIVVRRQSVDLAAFLHDVRRTSAQGDRIVLESAGKGQARIESDPHLLGMILRNLLDNALKYSPPSSPVILSHAVGDDPAVWRVDVANRPWRAGRPDPGQMFEKYYRSPGSSYVSGTGVGLYIVSQLALALQVRIVYEPDPEVIRFGIRGGAQGSGGRA